MRIIPDQPKKKKEKVFLYLDVSTVRLLETYGQFRDCTIDHIVTYAINYALKKDEEFETYRASRLGKGTDIAATEEPTNEETGLTFKESIKEAAKPPFDPKLAAKVAPRDAKPDGDKSAPSRMAEPVGRV